MKKILVLVLTLLPLLSWAQFDFETRYFTIDATSLPEVNVLETFMELNSNSFFTKLPEFKMNNDNYQKEVNMGEVLYASEKFVNSNYEVKAIEAKNFGFSTSQYKADASSAVKNFVYKPASGDPCPPFGICAKCAPYRVGRRY